MLKIGRYWVSLIVIMSLVVGCQGTPSAPPPTATSTTAPSPTPSPTVAPPTATPTPIPTATVVPLDLVKAEARTPQITSPVGTDGALVVGAGDMPWWNDVVFYEVFVRSFYDSNGDGIGDLNGLIEKLDYLNDGNPATTDDLGITGIWLMPIMQSPSYHGYDVTDYYTVEEDYGTNADFKRLMEEAHKRGIYVIIDLVLNHTSAQHPWFKEAQDPNSERRSWYLWNETGGTGWHRAPGDGYYFGLFWDQMPDLNYNNPDVTAEMHNVTRFWLEEMGVDGFRLDAIKHLIEEGTQTENTPATLDWFEGFYEFYKSVNPNAFTVAEVWSPTYVVAQYTGQKVDVCFEFDLAEVMKDAAFRGRPTGLLLAQENVIAAYPPGQYATFLANHDQTRTRSTLMNDEQAKVAATLQLTFSGIPFIYYGEEIGMQGAKPDENIRRPMQWTPDGGFSTGTPWKGYFEDYATRNITTQSATPDSILNHYRALIALRNHHAALRVGEWLPVEAKPASVYSYIRTYADEVVLVVVNLSGQAIADYTLTLAKGPFTAAHQPAWLMGDGDLYLPPVNAAGGFGAYRPIPVLPPNSSLVIQFMP
ncbi:MAG TPA: alpha-amylase family glycosyl hydrolase [Anaerolineae bacterium]|nr:alpha-amylase family glycosyl hydrolase [Anaerolineae bacterium]HQI86420.1 alpha-amylase family glycosyl hydrolase [Anaerolineae bacterium]